MTAYFLIDFHFDAYIERARADSSDAPIDTMVAQPVEAILYGIIFSVLLVIHWSAAGLLSKKGMAKMPVANFLLAGSALLSVIGLFERAATDFYSYSLFCAADEPMVVIFIDEVHRCQRSMSLLYVMGPASLLLPLIAIPVRIIESRLARKKK